MSQYTEMAIGDEQKEAIEAIEKWCNQLGLVICGGTKIGKYYDTVVLDLTFHGGEIYIHSNGFADTDFGNPGVTVHGYHVWQFGDFENAIKKGMK